MCTSQELRLLDCPVSTQLGLIEDPCACNGCAESLAVRCPGDYMIIYYIYYNCTKLES